MNRGTILEVEKYLSFVEYFCDRRVCARRQGGAGDVLFGTAQDVRSPVDDFAASVITQIHQQQIVGRELPLNSVDSPSALLQCILVPSNSISTCQGPKFRRTLSRGGGVSPGSLP